MTKETEGLRIYDDAPSVAICMHCEHYHPLVFSPDDIAIGGCTNTEADHCSHMVSAVHFACALFKCPEGSCRSCDLCRGK